MQFSQHLSNCKVNTLLRSPSLATSNQASATVPNWNSYMVQLQPPKKGKRKALLHHTRLLLFSSLHHSCRDPNHPDSTTAWHLPAAKTPEQLMKLPRACGGKSPFSSLLRHQQEFNNLPGEQGAHTKTSTLLPSPSAVRQRQSPRDVSTIIYWKREHSHGERPLLEPWQDKAAPQRARGSRHRSPHSTTPSLLLLQPRETLHPLGKARRGTQGMQEPSQSHC